MEVMTRLMEQFNSPGTEGWLEIIILAALIYALFRFLKGTRGSSIFTGLMVLLGALYAITSIISLDVLNWLLSEAYSISLFSAYYYFSA